MDENKDPFPELGSVYRRAGRGVNDLSHGSENINLGSAEDKKIVARSWNPQNSAFSAWGRSDLIKKLGMQSTGSAWKSDNNNSCNGDLSDSKQDKFAEDRWDVLCARQFGTTEVNGWKVNQKKECISNSQVADYKNDYDNGDGETVSYSSDDDYDFESDDSEKSHDSCKKIKLFKVFFDAMDKLSAEEINSVSRRWHCPACQGGPGAIGWYRGLESLITHARTKQTRRAKLHRLFVEVLNEELRRRGIQVIADGEAFGRWEGLSEEVDDFEIVWPPMVVIMNTRYEREENGKWIGMGSQELLDHFRSYAALKARHSYGPQGHRGMSVLIFDSSVAGYLEAIRLHMHFVEQGRDRNSWDHNRVPFCPGGKRQLYGYMALKEDLDIYSEGKSKLKFEVKMYKDMVYSQIKKLREESKLLAEFKNLHLKEQKESLAPVEPPSTLGDEQQNSAEENYILRPRTVLLLQQKKKERSSQQQTFEHQVRVVHQAIDEKEERFEKLQLAKREKVKLSQASLSTTEDTERGEATSEMVEKQMEEFEAERKTVIQSYEERKAAILNKYLEGQLQLEKDLENELTMLMGKYSSQVEDENGSS